MVIWRLLREQRVLERWHRRKTPALGWEDGKQMLPSGRRWEPGPRKAEWERDEGIAP